MNTHLIIPFRMLCTVQRVLLITIFLSSGIWLWADICGWENAFRWSRGCWAVAAGGFLVLGWMEFLYTRGRFHVSCPICHAPARPAAWTFVLHCYCRRCHQVYATGWLWLRFFAARRVDVASSRLE